MSKIQKTECTLTLLKLPEELLVRILLLNVDSVRAAWNCSQTCRTFYMVVKEKMNVWVRKQYCWERVGRKLERLSGLFVMLPVAERLIGKHMEMVPQGLPFEPTPLHRQVLQNVPMYLKQIAEAKAYMDRIKERCNTGDEHVECRLVEEGILRAVQAGERLKMAYALYPTPETDLEQEEGGEADVQFLTP